MPTNQGSFRDNRVGISAVYGDLSQEVVRTTVDRLRLTLHEHANDVGRSKEWIAPASLIVTILAALLTADFQKAILPAETWLAIFVIALVGCVAWLGIALYRWHRAKTIDDLVDIIKGDEIVDV